MKKIALFACLMGACLVCLGAAPTYAAEVDVLINKLVEKGILSQQEAGQLLNEMQKEGARQETTVKETAEKVAKETAQKAVKEESKTWAKLPTWVDRISVKGDFRLRYQYEDIKADNGDVTNRNRGRYRWRLGVVADVTEDKKWQVGFGLASGSGDPRSTNHNDFETPDARLDFAYAQYQPFKEWKIIGGQFKNPIYQTKDLVWDSDIRPQGVTAPFNYKVNDQFGHQVGDEVLAGFAKILQNNVRDYDLVSRYGGEEFLIIAPQTRGTSEDGLYERMRGAVQTARLETRQGAKSITVSIGVSGGGTDLSPDALLAAADGALYKAKQRGRNQVVYSSRISVKE